MGLSSYSQEKGDTLRKKEGRKAEPIKICVQCMH
jgi:hypothetical protein